MKQSKNDEFVFDLRKISISGPVLFKFFSTIIKFFPAGKTRFLAGRHYAMLMQLDIEIEKQLFLSVEDLEENLEIKLPVIV